MECNIDMKMHMQAEINKLIEWLYENVFKEETITARKDLISINIREGL